MSGFSSRVTVHMPSRPWKITTPSSTSGVATGWRGERRFSQANRAASTIESPRVVAAYRWIISRQALPASSSRCGNSDWAAARVSSSPGSTRWP